MGREGTLGLAPRLTAEEGGVEGANEAPRAVVENEERPNGLETRVLTGMRVCISGVDESGDGDTTLRRIAFERGVMNDDVLGVVSPDWGGVEPGLFGDSWIMEERRRGMEEAVGVVRLDWLPRPLFKEELDDSRPGSAGLAPPIFSPPPLPRLFGVRSATMEGSTCSMLMLVPSLVRMLCW